MQRSGLSGSLFVVFAVSLAITGCGSSDEALPESSPPLPRGLARLEGPGPIPATYLGSLGGASQAWAINDAGQVVGNSSFSDTDFNTHGLLWKDGVMTDLGTLGGKSSSAVDINAYGQVVGSASIIIAGRSYNHAFLWENGVMKDLGPPGPGSSSAKAINDSGQVVGVTGNLHGFSWKDGVMTDLGTLGGAQSDVTGLNASGQVIGFSYIAGNKGQHAFVWKDGVMTDLGTLGGSYSNAVAINDSGQVVGYAYVPGNKLYRAVLWQNGEIIDLGTPAEFSSLAVDINASGQVVGYVYDASNYRHNPFVWKDGVLTMLDAPGEGHCYTYRINNAGQVSGCFEEVGSHPFVWKDGVMTKLSTLGGLSGDVYDLNEAGQLVGRSDLAEGYYPYRATLWTADPSCIPVRLSEQNLFLLEDYTGGHHVEGRVAVGGDITLTDFSVGQAVPSASATPSLVAGGNLSLARGAVWGDAVHGGSYSVDSTVSFPQGNTVSQGTPLDFGARFGELRALSSWLSRVSANGSTTRTSWGGVMLRGTNPQTNTFDVEASAFTGARLLSIDAPTGSLVVVNIRGAAATFAGFGTSLSGGIQPRGILYNFVDATSVTASGYSFQGTVLAPYAHVSFSNGSFEGGLYAVSLTGDAAGHLNALDDRDVCH
ncbi:choice-of-anchor A family protein [Hyalangium versicolor]|uniref:choice-of-anchor A family protein n=1 Tax=Hyalangium versicolor TaxID=2861190 RepID=UPI001CC974C4|nr:choice-of-anchor A family protein [Hyalangium versicolor]